MEIGDTLERFPLEPSDLLALSETCTHLHRIATDLFMRQYTLCIRSEKASQSFPCRWQEIRSIGFIDCCPHLPCILPRLTEVYVERGHLVEEHTHAHWKHFFVNCPSLQKLEFHHRTHSVTHDILTRNMYSLLAMGVPRLRRLALDFTGPLYYFTSGTEVEKNLCDTVFTSESLTVFHNKTQWLLRIDAPLEEVVVRDKGLAAIGPKACSSLKTLTWYDADTCVLPDLARFQEVRSVSLTLGTRLFQEEVSSVLDVIGRVISPTVKALRLELPLSIFGREGHSFGREFRSFSNLEEFHLVVSHATGWIQDIFESKFFGIPSAKLRQVTIKLRRGQSIIDRDIYRSCMRSFPGCRCEMAHISVAGTQSID